MTLDTSVELAVMIVPKFLSYVLFTLELVSSVDLRTEQDSCRRIVVDIDKTVRSTWSCSNPLIYSSFGSPALVTVQTEITAVAHILTLSGWKLDKTKL
jgi:hypothetical protein